MRTLEELEAEWNLKQSQKRYEGTPSSSWEECPPLSWGTSVLQMPVVWCVGPASWMDVECGAVWAEAPCDVEQAAPFGSAEPAHPWAGMQSGSATPWEDEYVTASIPKAFQEEVVREIMALYDLRFEEGCREEDDEEKGEGDVTPAVDCGAVEKPVMRTLEELDKDWQRQKLRCRRGEAKA